MIKPLLFQSLENRQKIENCEKISKKLTKNCEVKNCQNFGNWKQSKIVKKNDKKLESVKLSKFWALSKNRKLCKKWQKIDKKWQKITKSKIAKILIIGKKSKRSNILSENFKFCQKSSSVMNPDNQLVGRCQSSLGIIIYHSIPDVRKASCQS